MRCCRTLTPGLILIGLLTWTVVMEGQIRSGAIVGRVVDPNELFLVGVRVTVVDLGTNARFETVTNTSGEYTAPYLQPGVYEVTALAEGFATSKATGIRVGVGETVRANFALSLPSVRTVVEVAANPNVLQTENATVQNTIGSTIIQSVPNITANPFYYATLQPGVSGGHNINNTQTNRAFGIGQESRRQYSEISINGGQQFTNELLLDGVSIQGPNRHEATVVPNPEGVQEVRTIVNSYSAEYGRGQGIITLATKSGTNEFHASAFYRLRNEALNANTFGNNARGIPRQPFKVNQYGGTVGGPIIRNKLFFFTSYEGLRFKSSEDYFGTVPTERERQGDFSQTLVNVSGVPRPLRLYDPFGVAQAGPNLYQRPEIPNAIIPRPNPFIVRLLSYYPLPNRRADDVYNTNNYFLRRLRTFQRDSVNGRIDHYWGKHSFYGTLGIYTGSNLGTSTWGADSDFQGGLSVFDGGLGLIVEDDNYYAALGNTFVASPTLVIDTRYAITRVNSQDAFPTKITDYDQFGIPKELQAIIPEPGTAPRTNFGPWSVLQGDTTQRKQHQITHHIVSSVTMTKNRWVLKFGGEYRVYLTNQGRHGPLQIRSNANHTRELITAAGAGVGVVTPDMAGHAAASLLLGAGDLFFTPDEGNLKHALAHKYGGLYTQNDWQATSRLKINLGLRWDVQPGMTERFDRGCGIDLNQRNPFGTLGKWVCAGRDGAARNFWNASWKDFAPRAGLTYRFSDKFVLRAGYGLTFLAANTGFGPTGFGYGVDMFQNVLDSQEFGLTPAGVLAGKFNEVYRLVPPIGYSPNDPLMYGGMESTFPRGQTQNNPRVQQWNLFLERHMGAMIFSAGYSASKGANLWVTRVPAQSAQVLPRALLDSWRQTYIQNDGRNNPADEQIPNPYQPVGGPLLRFPSVLGRATLSRLESNYPYPHFLGPVGTALSRTIGWSNYHSMVLQVRRALSRGLLFNGHYTWSKSIDFANNELNSGNELVNAGQGGGNFNLTNFRDNYAPSIFDRTHQGTAVVVFELPFGPGKPMPLGNPVLRAVLSGWRIGGVASFSSGTPLQVTGASNGSMNGRPDRLANVPTEVPKELQRWYDGKTTVTLPSGRQITPCNFCFLKYSSDVFRGRVVQTPNGSIQPDIYWLGSSALRFIEIRSRGQGSFNTSFDRTFRPREHLEISFSAEITNLLNHVWFRPNVNRALGATVTQARPGEGLQLGQGQSSDFGTHGTNTFDPRQVQFQLKVKF